MSINQYYIDKRKHCGNILILNPYIYTMHSDIIINSHDNYHSLEQKIDLIDCKVTLIVDVLFEVDNWLEA